MIDYPSQQGEDVGDYPLINYYLCNPTTHAHTLMHHCWNLLKKREKIQSLEGSGWAKISCPKGTANTHTHTSAGQKERL